MKPSPGLLIFAVACAFILLCSASATEAVSSGVISGVRAEFPLDASQTLSATHKISFGLLCTNLERVTIFFPKREYLVRLVLTDGTGALIQPTILGAAYGSRFSELTNYSLNAIEKVTSQKGVGSQY
jgi:hypothetical protein